MSGDERIATIRQALRRGPPTTAFAALDAVAAELAALTAFAREIVIEEARANPWEGECIYCHWNVDNNGRHNDDCIVLKARAALAGSVAATPGKPTT